jgi:hypothetical protein
MAQDYFDDIPPVRRPAPVERPGSAPRNRRRTPAEAAPSSPEAEGDTEPSRLGQFAAPMMVQPPESGPGLFDDIPAAGSNVSTLEDVVKSAGAGLVKGGIGLAALPGTVEQLGRTGINYVGQKLTGQPETVGAKAVLPGYQEFKGAVENNITGPLYNPKTTAGEYAGTVAEFAPGMLFPAGAGAGLAARAGLNVVAPAVASESAGQLTKGTAAEPYARVAGGLAGGMLPAMAGRAISPGATDPMRTRMAGVLDQEGVALTAGDRTGSRAIRYAESVSQTTPFAGRRLTGVKEQQAEQFTRAALRRAGIQADRAEPAVIDQAFQRIGGEFQAVGSAAMVPITPTVQSRLDQIVRNYERITEPSMVNPLPRSIIDDVQAVVGRSSQVGTPAALDGARYLGWRSDIGAAARGARDPRTERVLYDIQRVLDDGAEQYLRSTNPQMADRMRTARQEYRNILVLEKAVNGAGENAALGLISPAQLAQATKQLQGGRNYARGRGDYAELARAGDALLRPMPQSGTAERIMMQSIGAGAGGLAAGAPGVAAGMAGQAIVGRVLQNPATQAYLGNQVAAPIANLPTGSRIGAIPGIIANSNRPLDADRKTVRRKRGLLPE